jgi:hypothetical protein
MDDAVAGWENFFVAQVGASAALTGLLFVAVSINLAKILQLPSLPGRAAETLIGLFVVLGVASFGLVPHVTRRTFGIEILAVWVLACVAVGWIQIRSRRRREAVEWWTIRVVASHTPLFAFLGGGISLLAGRGEGPYWLLAGTLLGLAASAVNAWVLLVEIQR